MGAGRPAGPAALSLGSDHPAGWLLRVIVPVPPGPGRQRGPVLDADPTAEPINVVPDRGGAEMELVRHLAIGHAACDQVDALRLGLGRAAAGPRPGAGARPAGDAVPEAPAIAAEIEVEDRVAARDAAKRPAQLIFSA